MVYKQTDEKTDEVAEGDPEASHGYQGSTSPPRTARFLPAVCHKLSGDDPAGFFARLIEFATSIGFTVEDAELPGETSTATGTHELHRIRVGISHSPAQRVKTLAHEIGHALLDEQCRQLRIPALSDTQSGVFGHLAVRSEVA